MTIKYPILLFILFFLMRLSAQTVTTKEIRLSGNAYITENCKGASIGQNGLEEWKDAKSEIKTFVYFSKPQTVKIKLVGKLEEGRSRIHVDLITVDAPQNKKNSQKQIIDLNSGELNVVLKPFRVTIPGYAAITLQGVSRTGKNFGDITSIIIENDDEKMVYGPLLLG